MSDTPNNNGPSDEVLTNLIANLPAFTDGVLKGKLTGKGKSCPPVQMMPTKICKVCRGMWAPQYSTKPMEEAVCGECQTKLDQGFTACVAREKPSPDSQEVQHYAFCKWPKVPAVHGKIIEVPMDRMQKIWKEFDKRTKAN